MGITTEGLVNLHGPLSSEGLRPMTSRIQIPELFLHGPLSSEGLRPDATSYVRGYRCLHGPLSSEGLRQTDLAQDCHMNILHGPLSSEGLRRITRPEERDIRLARTSELGGVTTCNKRPETSRWLARTSELGGVTTARGRSPAQPTGLHGPLSSEGLRRAGGPARLRGVPCTDL